MNLLQTFIERLASQDEIRFLDAEELLKKQIGKKTLLKFWKENSVNTGTLSQMLSGKRTIPLRLIKRMDYTKNLKCITKNCSVPITDQKQIKNNVLIF